jgi:hypothetical protein
MFKCADGSAGILTTTITTFSELDYNNIVKDVIAKHASIDNTITATGNARGEFAGCLVRLAGHDFMDFRYKTAGGT